jgi:hypothetical protein
MNAAVDDSALTQLLSEQAPQPGAVPPPPKSAAPSAPVNQPTLDEVGNGYVEHRQALEGRAALSSLLSESSAPSKPDTADRGTSEPSQDPAAVFKQRVGRDPNPTELANFQAHPENWAGAPGAASKATVGDVAKDIGGGVVESPRAIVQGSRDAFQSMLNGASDLGTWLEKAGHLPGLKIDEHGVHVVSDEELQSLHRPFQGDQLPSLGEPKTVTGNVVKSTAQFITSMATLGRAFGPLGTDLEGTLGHLATAGKSVAALFTGFDKASGNLADLVEKVPSLSNPVTEFLQSDPTDNEAVGRLKNAVTGAGFGELQNGLLHALGMLRGGLAAKSALPAELPDTPGPEAPGTVQTPAAFKFLGNPDAGPEEPLAQIMRPDLEADKAARAAEAVEGLTPEQVAGMKEPANADDLAGPRVPGATEAQAKEPQVYINFARLDTPDDIKRVMSQLADAQVDNIRVAQRGIRTFEETKLGANFKDAWQTLMDRRSGQPLNDSEQLAGRQLLAQSAIKAEQLTQMTLENPTPENLFAWRKQMQTHAMIQAEVSGSQTEIARSLSAMRIPVSGQEAVDRMSAITSQLDKMGGLKSNMDFLTATKSLIDSGKLEQLGNVAEKSLYATTRDGLITAWTNGLLTNPLTHVKVNLSNIGTIALRMAETRFAEGMDQATDYNGVPAGEAAQTTAGLISGIKDSFRYVGSLMKLNEAPESSPVQDAAQAFKTGHYSVGEEPPDWAQQGQESANALSIADQGGWAGKATDLLSSVVTSPGRALAGEHEFYRSIGMRMELQRFAYRQAIDEVNAGKIQPGDVAGRIADLVENPPKSINTQAVAGMTYQTFTDAPGKLAEIIGNLREAYPSVRVILPFYKIPARIMSFTFERSPLAPLMAGWRADIAAGGARQSMALAKTGLGSMVMLAASDAVLNGTITGSGPRDKGQREAMMNEGWQPYSAKTPSGRWVQYNRLETVGSSMALAADLTETIRDYQTAVNADDPNVEKLTAAGIATLANNITSKTYFEGLARFFETISDPRGNAEGTLKSFAGSLVPAGVGAAASLMDPYQRATYSMMDAIKARTPGLSKDLPPVTNVWGEPIRKDSGFGTAYDAFVPFGSHRPGNEPIDQEILKQGMHVSLPPTKTSINGATVDLGKDPEMYHRYVELAGNELKSPAWGMGAKDLLNSIVSGDHPLSSIYNMKSDGPDGGKALMLRGLIEQYRRDAAQQVMHETPALAQRVDAVKQRQAQLKMPVVAQGTP